MSCPAQKMPSSEMGPAVAAQLQELLVRLLALDRLLGSVPLQHLQRQHNLDLDVTLSKELEHPILQEAAARYTTLTFDMNNLHWTVDKVPRFELIPEILVHICKTSWQGKVFENVYRHSDMNRSRDPTCSEALSLLRKLDKASGSRLRVKINTILRSVPSFRFFNLPPELRLRVYEYILPRQPYLVLRNLEPRRHVLPRYDLTVLRTCRRMHDELIDHFYKNQVLVMNVYDMVEKGEWAFCRMTPRNHLIVSSMKETTRSCFDSLEIRALDTKDPNIHRKGRHLEEWPAYGEWDFDQRFTEIIETFVNIKSVTVSFEIEGNNLMNWWTWNGTLEKIAGYLTSNIPRRMEVRWDFQPSSHPDLQEVEGFDITRTMDKAKDVVAKDAAKRREIVRTGKSIIKEYIPTRGRL